jgi:hypothetical protein
MTRKRIARITKHSKTYKGGASKPQFIRPIIPLVEDPIYNFETDEYKVLVSKFESKLLLNDVQLKSRLSVKPISGIFSKLVSMAQNLKGRPELYFNEVKTTGSIRLESETIKKLNVFSDNIKNIRNNYNTLYRLFDKNDPEIVFHLIIGCMQKLYKHMCDFLLFLPSTSFPKYTTDLINDSNFIAEQIEQLKETEYANSRKIKDDEFVPIKIGDNIAMYEVWEQNKTLTLQERPFYLKKIQTCLNWRVNHYYKKEKILATPYYKDQDACNRLSDKKKIPDPIESLSEKEKIPDPIESLEKNKKEMKNQSYIPTRLVEPWFNPGKGKLRPPMPRPRGVKKSS